MNQSGQTLRQQVAALLGAVADEQVAPQVAINRWPVPQGHQDTSLDCAFWALWHFEADEAQQQSELYYMDTQLELLRQMAGFLGQGRDLPPYMLAGYGDHPSVRFYYAHSLGRIIGSGWVNGGSALQPYGSRPSCFCLGNPFGSRKKAPS